MSESPITCLGGTLIRRGKDDYVWSDGMAAPGVVDLSISAHNFRCSTDGTGYTVVEVPESAALSANNPELHWCRDAARNYRRWRDYRGRPVIHVPLTDWDAYAADHPMGVEWPKEIEHYVLDKAQDLGWVHPGKTVSFAEACR
jgi:hypothetical protein